MQHSSATVEHVCDQRAGHFVRIISLVKGHVLKRLCWSMCVFPSLMGCQLFLHMPCDVCKIPLRSAAFSQKHAADMMGCRMVPVEGLLLREWA